MPRAARKTIHQPTDLRLQKLVHSRHCLHEREELEVTQTDVDAAEFAYLVRRVADKADWFSSKIMTDLGCVEVLESTPRGNSSNSSDGTFPSATFSHQSHKSAGGEF